LISKQYIDELKSNNINELYKLIQNCNQNKELLFVLSNLGRLPDQFEGEYLLPFLKSPNDNIRLWTVKNMGKLKNGNYLQKLSEVAQNDKNSMIRREATSSIGRMRNPKAIPFLLELLKVDDPKIILQSIRALLVFKYNSDVKRELSQLINHPNEMVQMVIRKEYFPNKSLSKSKFHHIESPKSMQNTVVYGDVIETLKYVPDESIHLTFTSPPYYNARDYSIYQSYQQYLKFLAEVFKEVHRVTKEGRFFILNTSPIIIPRISRQHSSKRYPIPFDIHPYLIDMGWEFIDDIIWIKPETSVKNRNAGFLQHRKPLGYKPNPVTEYVMVYRKKTDKLLDWNIKQYDIKLINECRVNGNYETSNAWEIDPVFDKVHSAVFPIELCNRIITFYSYKKDLVFDPFAGSGTLGKAAQNLGRNFFLTEKERDYVKLIKQNVTDKPLFDENAPRFVTIEQFKELIENEK